MRLQHHAENTREALNYLLSGHRPNYSQQPHRGVKSLLPEEIAFMSGVSYALPDFEKRVAQVDRVLRRAKIPVQTNTLFSLETTADEQFALLHHQFETPNRIILLEGSFPERRIQIYHGINPAYSGRFDEPLCKRYLKNLKEKI